MRTAIFIGAAIIAASISSDSLDKTMSYTTIQWILMVFIGMDIWDWLETHFGSK